jgi:cob(I)alamin adenosyltransferase
LVDRPEERGLVYLFTGDGKGKTSAALGIVLRALGHGLRVHITYFMKGNSSGELSILSKLPNVDFASFGGGRFVEGSNIKPGDKEKARQGLADARQAVLNGSYDVVVLDEVNLAVAWNLLELEEVLRLIADKPPKVELILTGRQADTRLIKAADLVTEMLNIKHPYEKGIKARKGIDY